MKKIKQRHGLVKMCCLGRVVQEEPSEKVIFELNSAQGGGTNYWKVCEGVTACRGKGKSKVPEADTNIEGPKRESRLVC